MRARATSTAGIESIQNGWRLRIPQGDDSAYRSSQLDDYFGLARRKFPHRSLILTLRARASSRSIPGTWGFGLWNDPFGLSLGFGGNRFRLPALPNAIWFFHASKHNYLSFTNDKAAQGFLAQLFHAPRFHRSLTLAGLILPFSRRAARTILSKVVDEDSAALSRIDVTQWHSYKFEWSATRSAFWVGDVLLLDSAVSPRPPLGLVIWIDNQYAAFTPEGKIGFGVLENPEPAWIEIRDLEILGS